VLGGAAGGFYVYTQNPDPVEVRAAVSGSFAGLHTRLNEAIATAQTAVDEIQAGEEAVDESDAAEAVDSAGVPEEEVAEAPTPQPASGDAGGEQSLDQYRAWIREARALHPYPESEERMYAAMMCESGGDAAIVNPAGPYSGLFQYSPATWNGDWNTYREEDIFDPRAQIFATALAWNNDMQSHWGCYSRAH